MKSLFQRSTSILRRTTRCDFVGISIFSNNNSNVNLRYQSDSVKTRRQSEDDANNTPLYVNKTMNIRLPQTQEEALTVLTNWNYIRGELFLEDLREGMLTYGKLTDKQMESMRKCIASKHFDKNHSAFKSVTLDPIIKFLINLTQDNLETISTNTNQETKEAISNMKEKYFKYGNLSPKQIKFAGNVFKQTFNNDEFNINGKRKQDNQNE